MTNRERILAALRGEETDRISFAPLADNYFTASLPAQGHAPEFLPAMRYIGCDIIERHTPCFDCSYEGGVEMKKIDFPDGKQEVHFLTKYGEIFQRYYYKNGTVYTEKHYIENAQDAKIYAYIARNTQYFPQFELFERRKAEIGDDGIPTPSAPCSPIMETLQVLCGLENTTYLLLDEEDVMLDLFEALHERNKRCYTMLREIGSPVVFTYEDTSTTIMSRDWFRDYAAPCLNDYGDILHGAGKIYITHMCGKLKGFKEEIAAIRSDGIDSVCPPTTGDTECWNAKEWFKSKVIIGGIEPSALVLQPEKDVLAYAREICERMRGVAGFIFSTGDAVPHGTSIELLKKINEIVVNAG